MLGTCRIWERQFARIENAGFGAVTLQNARGLFDQKPAEGSLPQRAVQQQNAGWMIGAFGGFQFGCIGLGQELRLQGWEVRHGKFQLVVDLSYISYNMEV